MNYPDFEQIRCQCDGMMRQEVYRKIYETAYRTNGQTFVEVGTAHGAATICIALGIKNSGKSSSILYTFDTFLGGGRSAYKRDKQQNINILKENLEKFKVDKFIKIIDGNISQTHASLKDEEKIDFLILDADGQIDRDFCFFYEKLIDNAPIIIDDFSERSRITVSSKSPEKGKIDQKHRLTYLLTKSAIKAGLIAEDKIVNQTWFGKKAGDKLLKNWSRTEILNAYRALIFATGEITYKV